MEINLGGTLFQNFDKVFDKLNLPTPPAGHTHNVKRMMCDGTSLPYCVIERCFTENRLRHRALSFIEMRIHGCATDEIISGFIK